MVNLLPKHVKHGGNSSTDKDEISFYRHWDAASETYAGGDSLATALYLGWKLENKVLLKEHWLLGKRCVKVYYFELIHDEARLIMPVIANPFVENLITVSELQVMQLRSTVGIEDSPNETLLKLQNGKLTAQKNLQT
jgi:hypothetical protein